MNWLLNSLREPSTWAGLAIIAGAVGDHLAAGAGPTGAVVGGVLAILLRERGKATTPPAK